MQLFSYVFLILTLIVDLLFYIPIKIYIYFDSKSFYFYIFSIAILSIDSNKNINLLKNKISLEKIFDTKKEDLKIINSIHIKKMVLSINQIKASNYAHIIYPLVNASYINKKIRFEIKEKNAIYVCLTVTIVNFLHELISIRRLKKIERKSN